MATKRSRMSKRSPDRKMLSGDRLDQCISKWALKEGDCLHFLTAGDVDLISFLRLIVRQQYCQRVIISCWVISGEDVMELAAWRNRGLIGRVDIHAGEVFDTSYEDVFLAAKELTEKSGGNVTISRNHMKAAVLQGENFGAVIESSANYNTNPRTENCVITVDRGIVDGYIDFFDNIKSWVRGSFGMKVF